MAERLQKYLAKADHNHLVNRKLPTRNLLSTSATSAKKHEEEKHRRYYRELG